MQQLVGMIEFKFTIGINKLYNGVLRNQRNKKKDDPWKITEEEVTVESLLEWCEGELEKVGVRKLNRKRRYLDSGGEGVLICSFYKVAIPSEMTHLVRVKKRRFIKLLPHITPYIRSGVNLWAMFHGRGTRRVIRDNW